MQVSQFHYLPLTPGFFAILVGISYRRLLLLRSALRYAYLSLGVSSGTAMLLLFGSLVGSYFNIPVVAAAAGTGDVRPGRRFLRHALRGAASSSHWPGTVIAVNIGGAVIPTLMSIYLLVSAELWANGLIATAIVALVLHWLADPVRRLRHCGAGIRAGRDHRDRRHGAVARGCCAARLYRRQPRYADRRRPHQSRQGPRPRRAGRLDRRRRNFRRYLPYRHSRGAAREPVSSDPEGWQRITEGTTLWSISGRSRAPRTPLCWFCLAMSGQSDPA